MDKDNREVNSMLDKEMIFSRIVNAPRELVYKVWTQQDHLEKWWGPDGFSTTTKLFELKNDGQWIFTMHGPDGRDYPNKIIFIEIDPPSKLVYRHSDDGGSIDVRFKVEVLFEQSGENTLITMHSVFETPEMMKKVVDEYGAYEGAIQHLKNMMIYIETLK